MCLQVFIGFESCLIRIYWFYKLLQVLICFKQLFYCFLYVFISFYGAHGTHGPVVGIFLIICLYGWQSKLFGITLFALFMFLFVNCVLKFLLFFVCSCLGQIFLIVCLYGFLGSHFWHVFVKNKKKTRKFFKFFSVCSYPGGIFLITIRLPHPFH